MYNYCVLINFSFYYLAQLHAHTHTITKEKVEGGGDG